MDAASAALIGALGGAAVGGLIGGVAGYLTNRQTIGADWHRAHAVQLADRKANAYAEVGVVVTRVNGMVTGAIVAIREGRDRLPGPTVPSDDEWSAVAGTVVTIASIEVDNKLQTLNGHVSAFARACGLTSGRSWDPRTVRPSAIPSIEAAGEAVRGAATELVTTMNKELTDIPAPTSRGRRRVTRAGAAR